MLAHLRAIARGVHSAVTSSDGVTGSVWLRQKTPEFRQLRPLRQKRDEGENKNAEAPAGSVGQMPHADAIEELVGLASNRVPPLYLEAWARLNHQKPLGVSEAEWRLALDDGGRFLDAWGSEAAHMRWTPGELFDVTAGLVWRLAGQHAEAIGADHVRLSDGRTIVRSENLRRLGQAHMKTVRSLCHG
jgi:hypothetical protein